MQESSDPTTQVSFKLPEATLELIDQLKRSFNCSSRAEVLRKSLALLELARKARDEGGSLGVFYPDGKATNILVA
jgi:Arc/MetJ-type ribon-helix-helix transcriptional regulator